jgi:excisionase family DNA binding protein
LSRFRTTLDPQLTALAADAASRASSASSEWLTLGEASTLLSVAPATLRRWADAGQIPVFTTPGGHRRFARTALVRMLAPGLPARDETGGRALTTHGALVTVTPARLRRSYRREVRTASSDMGWLRHLSAEQIAWFRERGRRMAALLIAHLDAASPEAGAHALNEASGIAVEYGRLTGRLGLSMGQSVEGFLRFRRPFLHELSAAAQRRGFDAGDTGSLLEAAERSMDRLLVALLGAHGVTRVGELMGHQPAGALPAAAGNPASPPALDPGPGSP